MKIYKSKLFARFARKARITDRELWQAAQRANQGAIDADLGGGVLKQRIARRGEGKSGGSRTIILFKKDDRAVYVYGYEKKNRPAIKMDELNGFRSLARVILGYTPGELEERVRDGEFFGVGIGEKKEDAEEIS